MSADDRERVALHAPTVTPEREQAWQQWKDDYLAACAESWLARGATRGEVIDSAAVVLHDLRQIDNLPWMPLGIALTYRTLGSLREEPLVGGERTEYVRALRTGETSTEEERTLVLAHQLGLTIHQANNIRDRALAASDRTREPAGAGRTALYRHFDAAGTLLYVGITKDPSKRAEQHRYHSQWFRFTADSSVEWFDARRTAADAERDAIRHERPVFNDTHNKANRDAAIDYLFAVVAPVAQDGAA